MGSAISHSIVQHFWHRGADLDADCRCLDHRLHFFHQAESREIVSWRKRHQISETPLQSRFVAAPRFKMTSHERADALPVALPR